MLTGFVAARGPPFFGVDEGQPPFVVEQFGPNGEFLRGPGVTLDSDGYRYLSASTEVFLAHGLSSGGPNVLQQPATLVGIVQDESGLGIVDATVACSPDGEPLTSGEQPVAGGGYYCALQPGRYTITARAEGYKPQSIVVDLEPGADRLINFTMRPVP